MQESTASRFAKKGMSVATVIASVGGGLYALSHPHDGLRLQIIILLLACPIIGALLGYVVGKFSDSGD